MKKEIIILKSFLIKIGLLTIFCLFFMNELMADEFLKDCVFENDKVLSGRVVIEGKVVVEKNAVLYIKPGTQIFFKFSDKDGDGVSETALFVYGNIIAKGERNSKILFTSYEKEKKWGDWREIQINYVKGFIFEWVEIQYSEYGLHVHFSEGEVKKSIFRYNNDCTRLGNSKIVFRNNLFEKNAGKALNFTNCNIIFQENVVRDNREGIFVFEKVGSIDIAKNNIYNNFKNIKTGDFFREKLVLGENFIYPENVDGNVSVSYAKQPLDRILPQEKSFYISFSIETDGFVDGGGLISNNRLYIPSFDGHLYEYDLSKKILRKFFTGDFIDSVPIVENEKIFYQNWSGEIGYFDLISGQKKIICNFDKTLKDDHRNPSPIKKNNKIIFLSPGGSLIIIDTEKNKEIYRTKISGEFRATPLLKDGYLYITSTDGYIYKFSVDTFSISKIVLDDNFYASPVSYFDYIVLTGKNGNVFFIDQDFEIKKVVTLDSTFRYQSPVIYNDNLYFFSLEGKVYRVNWNLEYQKIATIQDIFTATPAIYKDYIVVPSFYGNLYFYGEDKLLVVPDLGEIQFNPLIYGDIIIVGSRANRVYGIKIW